MEIDEFAHFVETIRKTEIALGEEVKVPSSAEIENRDLVRKSIYVAKPIQKGEIFEEANLITMRPADGLSPVFWDDLIGKPSKRFYSTGERIDKHEI